MKAYITSIGEPTTELCVWSLERNGFDVEVFENPNTTLQQKLKDIYFDAADDFLRVDADIVVNKNMTPGFLRSLDQLKYHAWWWQFITFDWFKQDVAHTMSFTKAEALPALRENVERFKDNLRPETELSRIKEFYSPRRMETYADRLMGLHGYGVKDIERVKQLKADRKQLALYDFELAGRLSAL